MCFEFMHNLAGEMFDERAAINTVVYYGPVVLPNSL